MSMRCKPPLGLTILAIVLSGFGFIAGAFDGETVACPEPVSAACENARLNLAEGQSEAHAAADRRALWTTAVSALKAAKDAFERGNYAAAVRAASTSVDQARLGVAQAQYLLFPPPNPGGR